MRHARWRALMCWGSFSRSKYSFACLNFLSGGAGHEMCLRERSEELIRALLPALPNGAGAVTAGPRMSERADLGPYYPSCPTAQARLPPGPR